MTPTCVLLLASALLSPVLPTPAERHLQKLQGKWRVVGGEKLGKPFVPGRGDHWCWTFADRKLTVREETCEPDEYRISLDPTPGADRIDLVYPDRRHGVSHGIYELDGNRLRLCLEFDITSNTPDERPSKFTSERHMRPNGQPGHGRMLLELERVKP